MLSSHYPDSFSNTGLKKNWKTDILCTRPLESENKSF